MSLGDTGFERKTKRTRKREFLDEMNLVVPWAELVTLIAQHAPAPGAKGGRPAFAVATMLRIHFLHVVQPLRPCGGRSAVRHADVSRIRQT
jgi:IS5 family transposase